MGELPESDQHLNALEGKGQMYPHSKTYWLLLAGTGTDEFFVAVRALFLSLNRRGRAGGKGNRLENEN